MSKRHNPSLQAMMAKYLPAAQAAGCFYAPGGLSGGSLHIKAGAREYAARHQLAAPIPGISLKRHYRALKRLPEGIGPRPVCLAQGWLIVEWLEGFVKSESVPQSALGALLHHLHRQPCFGWRISLLPLLEHYWLNASPDRRSLQWLRQLKDMKQRGEPKPLRLAPLHMDVHAGNIVYQQDRLRLIDWEYAGDGDIALELAAAIGTHNSAGDTLIRTYAQLSHIVPEVLQSQVTRWQPWVIMLMASWYECRWQQSKDRTFLTLADEAWSLLRVTNI